jgi:hypothetical protein
MLDLYFVSCTRGAKEATFLHRSMVKHKISTYQFFENNTAGLPSCYNQILDARVGRKEIIVFAHDDILIGDISLYEKLCGTIEDGFSVVGVAGTDTFEIAPAVGPTVWFHRDKRHNSGAVEHIRQADNGDAIFVMDDYGSYPRRCVVLDGVLLAVDASRVANVRFDERFAFHFYDLDFCLACHNAGLQLSTTNLYLSHASAGGYMSPSFMAAQALFRAKWAGTDVVAVPRTYSSARPSGAGCGPGH